MFLRDVMVLPNYHSKDAVHQLRQSSDHVLDILRHHLPPRYDLGDMRRVLIHLGTWRAVEGRQAPGPGLQQVCDGVGDFYVPTFDLDAYFDAPDEEQHARILHCAGDVLLDLARAFGTDPEPLRHAADSVRTLGFKLDIERPCSRSHPSRRLRVSVVRRFARGGVFVHAEVKSKQGQVLHVQPLLEGAWVATANDTFHGSRWNGDTLELLDHAGRNVAEVPCAEYLHA